MLRKFVHRIWELIDEDLGDESESIYNMGPDLSTKSGLGSALIVIGAMLTVMGLFLIVALLISRGDRAILWALSPFLIGGLILLVVGIYLARIHKSKPPMRQDDIDKSLERIKK